MNFINPICTILFVLISINCTLAQDFITQWKYTSPPDSITFFAETSGTVNYSWNSIGVTGMGSFDMPAGGQVVISNVLMVPNIPVTLTIESTNLERFYINNGPHADALSRVTQWGNAQWTSMEQAFKGCSNLDITATDLPDLSGVSSCFEMFYQCSSLDGPSNIGSWNMSSIDNIRSMFHGASSFNQPIGNWNTSNISNFRATFNSASAFDQPLNTWDVSSATTLNSTFAYATSFNQDLSSWDVSGVSDFTSTFLNTSSFNQNIGTWDFVSAGSFLAAFLNNSGLDCGNYTGSIIGWASNYTGINPKSIHVLGLQYGTNAVPARTSLGWSFVGDAATNTTCQVPLPVEYLYINAEQRNSIVSIDWTTVNEVNCSHFIIEHSLNGYKYNQIGIIEGHINSEQQIDYNFIHESPSQGNNTYRLKQIDLDGKYEYSNPVFCYFEMDHRFSVYPNPVLDKRINIQSEIDDVIHIYSHLGQLIKSLKVDKNSIELDLSNWSNGVYHIKNTSKKKSLTIMVY